MNGNHAHMWVILTVTVVPSTNCHYMWVSSICRSFSQPEAIAMSLCLQKFWAQVPLIRSWYPEKSEYYTLHSQTSSWCTVESHRAQSCIWSGRRGCRNQLVSTQGFWINVLLIRSLALYSSRASKQSLCVSAGFSMYRHLQYYWCQALLKARLDTATSRNCALPTYFCGYSNLGT